jgi:hypothetical protein
VESKGLLPNSIAELWKILDPARAEPFTKAWIIENETIDNENTIYQIPCTFVTAVAQASEDRIRAIKLDWLYGGRTPRPDPLDGIVKDWFDEFIDLVREASKLQINVYVWLCP